MKFTRINLLRIYSEFTFNDCAKHIKNQGALESSSAPFFVLQVPALLIKVILVGADCELVAGGFVADHDGVWVHLEHGRSPLVADVAVDAVLEPPGL